MRSRRMVVALGVRTKEQACDMRQTRLTPERCGKKWRVGKWPGKETKKEDCYKLN